VPAGSHKYQHGQRDAHEQHEQDLMASVGCAGLTTGGQQVEAAVPARAATGEQPMAYEVERDGAQVGSSDHQSLTAAHQSSSGIRHHQMDQDGQVKRADENPGTEHDLAVYGPDRPREPSKTHPNHQQARPAAGPVHRRDHTEQRK